MRRGLKNKLSIFLIIIIGIFTIFSYAFDQLVIREEDNLRINQIKFDNLNTSIAKLHSITNQLTVSYDTSSRNAMDLKRYRNFWIKGILLITDYKYLNLNLKDLEIIESFNDEPDYLNNLLKYRSINYMQDIITAINKQIETLYNIYGWNLNFFPQYNSDGYYNGPDITYYELFGENIEIFHEKDFVKFTKILIDDDNLNEAIRNYKIENWIDINKFSYLLLEKLIELSDLPLQDSYKIENLIIENETKRSEVMQELKNISSKKNFFILGGIISQIASLLFLLILFRSLINSKL